MGDLAVCMSNLTNCTGAGSDFLTAIATTIQPGGEGDGDYDDDDDDDEWWRVYVTLQDFSPCDAQFLSTCC